MRSRSWTFRTIVRPAVIFSCLALPITGLSSARAQGWPGYAGGPQHSGVSTVASQFPQAILWSTPVDLNPQNQFGVLNIHYGSPLVTPKNTVIVPVKTGAFEGFRIEAHKGSDGTLIWQLDSDYTLPPFFDWILPFQSVLTGGSGGDGRQWWYHYSSLFARSSERKRHQAGLLRDRKLQREPRRLQCFRADHHADHERFVR